MGANTSGLGEGRADATTRSGADGRARGRVPGSGRTTSSLRTTRRVMGRSTVESILTPSTCVYGAARSCASRVGSRVSSVTASAQGVRRRQATVCLDPFATMINRRAAPVLALEAVQGARTGADSFLANLSVKACSAEFACIVLRLPRWSVFSACSKSKASGPRTSPTRMRSGPQVQNPVLGGLRPDWGRLPSQKRTNLADRLQLCTYACRKIRSIERYWIVTCSRSRVA
jgi:hypothetical protein